MRVFFITSGRSFMKITKRRGPITDPCGIPLITSCQLENMLLIRIRCFLCESRSMIQLIRFPFIP